MCTSCPHVHSSARYTRRGILLVACVFLGCPGRPRLPATRACVHSNDFRLQTATMPAGEQVSAQQEVALLAAISAAISVQKEASLLAACQFEIPTQPMDSNAAPTPNAVPMQPPR